MKILHTSDWHIGQIFYNYDRSDEHKFFFEWLGDVVFEQRPDVMVVCGDIFHTANPSTASQKLYIESLIKIHEVHPEMVIVVTAGNHDSGARIEVDRLLWENFNVWTVGSVARDVDGIEKHIIPVGNPTKGYVVAVPHCYPQNFPAFGEAVQREERQVAFFRRLLDEVDRLNEQRLPVVMTAHTTVTGSNPGKQELSIGGLDSIDVKELGEGFDYLALGHIHFPQDVGDRARYCGSPLPVSFNEDYQHGVTIVECDEFGGDVCRKVLKAPLKRSVVTLPDVAEEFEDALKVLENFPDDKEAYIRLNVKTKQFGGADWPERAMAATAGKKCRYCCLLTDVESVKRDIKGSNFSQEEFKQMSPLEIAKLHWLESKEEEMDEELARLMECAIKEIMED